MKAKAKDIMCANPQCCRPDDSIREAAKLMDKCDCGAIPVIQDNGVRKAVGVITDRDIALRAVAEGKGPDTKVRECMSTPLAAIGADSTAEECCGMMENAKVRRLMVVDSDGELCGIISQADIALHLSRAKIGEVVKEVSEPTGQSSHVEEASREQGSSE